MKLSAKTQAIAPSLTLEIDAKAKKMKADGEDVIGFGAGEPDFDTPAFIKDAAKEALDKGLTKYTPAAGTMDLRQAICDKLKAQNGLSYEPAQIIVSNGAKHSLFNAFAAIVEEGDEVILPAPYWVTYPELIQYNGGKAVFVQSREENGFVPTIEDLRAAVTDKTVAISINSPSNPTGAVYDRALLQQIADLAIEKDLYVVTDEIYEELIYDGCEHVSIASLGEDIKERTILVNGFSKAYAMTGWRLGYTASSKAVAKAMSALQSHATSNPNTMAQYAAVKALTGSRDEMEFMVKEFDKRRQYMVERINGIEGLSCATPHGAFYVMMNISKQLGKRAAGHTIEGSIDFAGALLEGAKVAVVPGIAFGADDLCRLSYAISMENIQKGLDRIEAFVSQLQ